MMTMKNILIITLLFLATIANGQVKPFKSSFGNTTVRAYSFGNGYDQFTMIVTNPNDSLGFEFNGLIHFNKIGSGYANHSSIVEVDTNSKVKYNFSHSVLTQGKPYDEIIKDNGGVFNLPITTNILDVEMLDENNILILSNTGLYLFSVLESELTILNESEFDEHGKIKKHYNNIIIDGKIVTLEGNKKLSESEMKDFYTTGKKLEKYRELFVIDITTKKIFNL